MDEVSALCDAITCELDKPAILERLRAAIPYMSNLDAVGHPNGFIAITLVKDGRMEVRLHLWTGAELAQEEHAIHNHVYDLRSLVLIGGLHQTRWTIETDSQGPLEEFTVTYANAGSALTATGNKVRPNIVSKDHFVAGDRYEVRAGEFHSITPAKIPSATLFAKMPADHPDLARVVGRNLPDGQLQSERQPLSPEQIEQCLRQLATSTI
jgi:hypothetical protein